MNNEPIVWMAEVEGGTMYTNYEYPESIPLYTHPVKELTDEEIWEAAKEAYGDAVGLYNHAGFARAILRKAQEK